MGTVNYQTPGGFLGKRSIGSLNALEGILNVEISADQLSATIAPLDVPTCEGVFCRIESLGYKARLP